MRIAESKIRVAFQILVILVVLTGSVALLMKWFNNRYMSMGQICEGNPHHCAGLVTGWCLSEQEDLVVARWNDGLHGNAHSLYDYLMAVDGYESCIEPVTAIEPKNNPGRKSDRVESYLAALEERKLLLSRLESEQADEPWLLFYRWTQLRDNASKLRLLELDRQGRLDAPEFRKMSAFLYAKFDTATAIERLEQALKEQAAFTQIDLEIPQQLSTFYFDEGELSRGYLWARVASHLEPETVTLSRIKALKGLDADEQSWLDAMAKKVISQITLGRYRGLPSDPTLEPLEKLSLYPLLHGPLNLLYGKELANQTPVG